MERLKLNYSTIITLLFAVAVVILFFQNCKGNETEVVLVPAVKGNFQFVKPTHTIITDTIILTNNVQSENPLLQTEIDRLLKENLELDDAFMRQNDSLQQLLYKSAITIKSFNHEFKNDTIDIFVNGLVRGTVESIGLKYIIHERKVEVPKAKETVFRLLGGVETGATRDLNLGTYKLNLAVQNRRGNLFTASFQQIGSGQYCLVGFYKSVFSIKR